jgi:hypothetical protein
VAPTAQSRQGENGGWRAASSFAAEFAFRPQKAAAKALNNGSYAILCREINTLRWSDRRRFKPAMLSAFGLLQRVELIDIAALVHLSERRGFDKLRRTPLRVPRFSFG